jgi:peptide/nickel transport system substrate-binding protein
MTRRSAALLLPVLGVLSACGSREQRALTKDHPNELRAPVDYPTMAWRKDSEGTKPETGGTVVLTILQDIDSLNPFVSSSAEASYIHDMLFPHVTDEQPDYYARPPTFEPAICDRWERGADGRSIRFHLRDCTWSDGTPITSDDVRFSWEAARHPAVAWVNASIVDHIADVEVVSPKEFVVRYTEDYPYQHMDINDVQVLPKHVFGKVPFEQWQQYGRWEEQAKVSGGPWMLERYVQNDEITFVRNPRYWDTGKPYLDRVVYKVVGSMETNLTQLLAGNVDYMQSVLPKDAQRVLEDGDLLLYNYTSRNIGWIGWNCGRAPFDDVRVRRALAHAIDRENIVESVLYGYAEVGGPAIIRSMWASNHDIVPLPYDPAAAEKLLDEAGWKRGGDGTRAKDGKPLQFVLVTNMGNDIRKRIAEYAQAGLRKVGVEVEVRLQDFNQMSQQLKRHDFDAFVGGMSVATKVDGKPVFHSASTEGSYNYPNFKNARVDEIIDRARVMGDQKAAKPLWDEMQRILHEEQPYTTIYEPRGLVGLSKRIRNAKVAAPRPTFNLHEWWIPKAEQAKR